MPFTLAHPAAVLPLRRYCPRYLSLGALVVGSIVPDAGYILTRLKVDELAHSFAGSFAFSLPVGMAMLALLYAVRRPLVEFLPEPQRRAFLPLCAAPVASPLVLIVSLLLGSWTHLAWDSFTHRSGWLVRHLPFLQITFGHIGNHRVMLCRVLWYLCSCIGVGCVYFAYEEWRQKAETDAPRTTALRNALLLGLLVLPIALVHDLAPRGTGFAVVGLCSVALVLAAAFGLGNRFRARPQP